MPTTITATSTENVIILIDLPTMSVVTAAMDIPAQRQPLLAANPGTHPLTGQVAKVLFIALTGREFTAEPETSLRATAMQARRDLLTMFGRDGYDVALGVLGCAGSILRPNLGATLLDQNGHIVPRTQLYAVPLAETNGRSR